MLSGSKMIMPKMTLNVMKGRETDTKKPNFNYFMKLFIHLVSLLNIRVM